MRRIVICHNGTTTNQSNFANPMGCCVLSPANIARRLWESQVSHNWIGYLQKVICPVSVLLHFPLSSLPTKMWRVINVYRSTNNFRAVNNHIGTATRCLHTVTIHTLSVSNAFPKQVNWRNHKGWIVTGRLFCKPHLQYMVRVMGHLKVLHNLQSSIIPNPLSLKLVGPRYTPLFTWYHHRPWQI